MKYQKQILPLLLFLIVVVVRLPGLGSFVAVDEPAWLTRGVNFYYALGQREFQNTVYEYHPSVTTMWFVAAATLIYFPESRGLGQGYFDVDKETFDPFLLEHGKLPIQLLYISRLLQVLVIALTAVFIYYCLGKLFGEGSAFFAVILITSSPYFFGHSRTLSHEGMVSVFVLASILGLIVYLEYERKWHFLFASAVFAALAQLTKSSAMAMMPAVALIFAAAVFQNRHAKGFFSALLTHLKIFTIWFFILIVVYVLVWPGMWVAPAEMLGNVYGNAFSYAFQGARLDVTHELQPSQFKLASMSGTFLSFLLNVARRATPIMWAGLVFAVIFLFTRRKEDFFFTLKKINAYLFTVAIMFIILFSAVRGRNSAHYIMTTHLSIDLIAALGWCAFFIWLESKWKPVRGRFVGVGGAAVLILLHVLGSLSFHPYYYTYNNPLMSALTGRTAISDYGEGFERAAAYLAQKPGAENLVIYSYRGRGPFSYFFPGKTLLVNPLFIEEPGMVSMIERLGVSDYLVVNDAFALRTERTAFFMQELNKFISPEYSLQVKDAYTIRVYHLKNLPSAFYDAIAK